MKQISLDNLRELYLPPKSSHKGQNGRLLIIGGSHLFHAASLWALKVASRIVDLVHYSSVPENNELVMRLKSEFRDGIVVPRAEIESYIEEDDTILIGPGMVRTEKSKVPASPAGRKSQKLKLQFKIKNLQDVEQIQDEGEQTVALTNYLLDKYAQKQWVIDAGALQMLDVNLIPKKAILTPHQGEFTQLLSKVADPRFQDLLERATLSDQVKLFAKRFSCIVIVKGEKDIVCSGGECDGKICAPGECVEVLGGNSGMTKGGTGDVLAGLIAALATKNEPFLATIAGSFINKAAGDSLFRRVGPFFNASDLANEIPKVMKEILH